MQVIHIRTNATAGVINALAIIAVIFGAGLLLAADYPRAAVAFVLGVVLYVALRSLYSQLEDATPIQEEYEGHQVQQMPMPCGVCGTRRPWGELQPHPIHASVRICPDGLCYGTHEPSKGAA